VPDVSLRIVPTASNTRPINQGLSTGKGKKFISS